MSEIITVDGNPFHTLATTADDTSRAARLRNFARWLDATELDWLDVDLEWWVNDLITDGLSPASAKSYLVSVRKAYHDLMANDRVRNDILAGMPDEWAVSDRIAAMNEMFSRLSNRLRNVSVQTADKRDVFDDDHLRLTPQQAAQLLRAPLGSVNDGQPLRRARDVAIIGLMLATGLRKAEVAHLHVDDLRQKINGELAIRVREGKGAVTRGVVWGELADYLTLVDRWCTAAGITDGCVFHSIDRWDHLLAPISTRAIGRLLDRYPLYIDGEEVCINPHDLRRTYARQQFDRGMPLLALRDNLGHKDIKTTQTYIGVSHIDTRRGRGGDDDGLADILDRM